MNFISVQQSLRQVFERVFAEDATTRHYNLENKSELVLRTLFQNLESRPAIQKVKCNGQSDLSVLNSI
jgi:hypothetical protein